MTLNEAKPHYNLPDSGCSSDGQIRIRGWYWLRVRRFDRFRLQLFLISPQLACDILAIHSSIDDRRLCSGDRSRLQYFEHRSYVLHLQAARMVRPLPKRIRTHLKPSPASPRTLPKGFSPPLMTPAAHPNPRGKVEHKASPFLAAQYSTRNNKSPSSSLSVQSTPRGGKGRASRMHE